MPSRKYDFSQAFFLLLTGAVCLQLIFFNSYIWSVSLFYPDYVPWKIVALGTAYILLSSIYLFPYRQWMVFFLMLEVGMTLFVYLDLLHLRYFGTPLMIFEIFQMSNLKGTRDLVLSMMLGRDIIFFLPMSLVILILFYGRKKSVEFKRDLVKCLSMIILGGSLFGMKIFFNRSSPWHQWFLEAAPYGQSRLLFREYGPLAYHVYDGARFVSNLITNAIVLPDNGQILRWFESKHIALKDLVCDDALRGIAKGKNIIILEMESLHIGVLNKQFAQRSITPHLNRMMKEGIFFPNFYSQIGLGRTAAVEFMINTSIYPAVDESISFCFDVHSYPSLPRLLKQLGYATFAAHGNRGEYWNRSVFLPALGFDEFKDMFAFAKQEIGVWGIYDQPFLEQAVSFLKEKPQPFFAYLITVSGHYPFEIGRKQAYFARTDPSVSSQEYDYINTAHYVDEAIGSFIGSLDKAGLMKNTLIVVVGDHHPFLYSNEVMRISQLRFPELFEAQSRHRVPFIIYFPGCPAIVNNAYGGQIDVLPTLLHLLGVENDTWRKYLMGRNLFCSGGNFVLVDGKVISDGRDDPSAREFYLTGYKIAEKIIRSNYFKVDKQKKGLPRR